MGRPAGNTRSWKTTGDSGVNVVSSRRGAARSRRDWRAERSQVRVARNAATGPESYFASSTSVPPSPGIRKSFRVCQAGPASRLACRSPAPALAASATSRVSTGAMACLLMMVLYEGTALGGRSKLRHTSPLPVMVAHSAPVRMARARGLRLRPAGARRARRRRASRRPRPAHRGHRPQGPADRRRQQRADVPCGRRPLRHDPLDAADAGERGQVRLALLRAGRADPGHPRVALVERLVHARLRERHDRRDRRAAATGGGGAGLRFLAVRRR